MLSICGLQDGVPESVLHVALWRDSGAKERYATSAHRAVQRMISALACNAGFITLASILARSIFIGEQGQRHGLSDTRGGAA